MMYMFLICYDPRVPLGPDDPKTLQPEHAALGEALGVDVAVAVDESHRRDGIGGVSVRHVTDTGVHDPTARSTILVVFDHRPRVFVSRLRLRETRRKRAGGSERAEARGRQPTGSGRFVGRFDLEAREERLRGGHATGIGRMGPPRELVEDRRPAVAVRTVAVRVPELGQDPRRRRRQERRRRQPDEPAGLEEVAQDLAQSRPGRLVTALPGLGQGPRLLGIDDLVGAADVLPQLRERVMQEAALERLLVAAIVSLQPSASGETDAACGGGRSPSR